MASKNIRIRDWATQYGLQNKDVIAALDEFGFTGKTASSNLPPEAVDRLVAKFKLKPAGKPASESKPALAEKAAKPAAPKKAEEPKKETPKPQPQTQAPVQPKPQPQAQPKPQAQAQPKPQAQASVQPKPQAQAPVQPKPQPQIQPKPQHVLGGNAAKFTSDLDDGDDDAMQGHRERFNHPGGGKNFRHETRGPGHDNRDNRDNRNRDNRDNRNRDNRGRDNRDNRQIGRAHV